MHYVSKIMKISNIVQLSIEINEKFTISKINFITSFYRPQKELENLALFSKK